MSLFCTKRRLVTPLCLLMEERERLSERYNKIVGSKRRLHRDDLYRLPMLIDFYDKSISTLSEGE